MKKFANPANEFLLQTGGQRDLHDRPYADNYFSPKTSKVPKHQTKTSLNIKM